jgi:cardiolipin synthase A/B
MPEKNPRYMPSRDKSPHMYEALHPSFFSEDKAPQTEHVGRTNLFDVIPTSRRFFEDLEGRIQKAQKSIGLQFYTLEADETVIPILNAAKEAAHRGVDVRILIDHTASDPRLLIPTTQAIRRINSLPNMEIKHTDTGLNPLTRDHKKIVVIDADHDEGEAYIGGINLAKRSLYWNDFMVRMQGSITNLVQDDFNRTWDGKNNHPVLISDKEQDTSLITDAKDGGKIVDFAIEKAREAEERIWLETPYLDVAGIGTVIKEAKQANPSLDVRVIVPRFNNYPMHRLRVDQMLDPLADVGIETYKYGVTYRRLNHTKLLLIDDMAMYGSSNFNLSHIAGNNADIEIASRNGNLVEQLERWYIEDSKESVLYR